MVYAISILALVLIFTIATKVPINMGILAFAGAFLVGGWVSGIPIDDIVDAFPGDIFLIVAGITLLFAIAKANGTINIIVESALRLVHGRRWALVWMMFLLSGALMALGSPMAAGMLAPIAMRLAGKKKINPLLMGMAINHGALGCAFSPITIYGAFVNGLIKSAGYEANPMLLFIVPFALNTLFLAVLFAIYGRDLLHELPEDRDEITGASAGAPTRPHPSPGSGTASATAVLPDVDVIGHTPFNRERAATLIGILLLAVGSVAFNVDVGVSSICISTVLLLMAPKKMPRIEDKVAWPAVVLVCGMLTYMTVLKQNGTLDFLGDAATHLGSPLAAALILLYAAAIISAVGSSIGTLGIALPLAAPMLAAGELGALGFIIALAFASTVVDVSPFATNGSIVVAEADVEDRQRFQRSVLAYCGLVVLLAPLVAWALIVVPTSL
ncbi:SLC13 family permease [Rhodococcus opacus]|uniref:SLC13 family permease n=1 Tax=Rhodococcus opacus TaxID=37919 RepID=A0AAX3YDG2_RHOOP|nr:SLC13 family permease [Rhodococcus opacus]NHU42754.1 C4-dicarboxylate ABC transporter [Rhodococcus sp. A14]MBA8961208.1 di/tricarboxylate transporter [Rhodococcus opacus]MBP2202928.1 di/tricarboxylate transporter [Rhodococcus opacus]MCZ4583556.1 SLC13 family permease [Rhodococcus opacus]QZS59402.1 C4-dicarboxylate ABC transporter [Rhodococcus opacus]